MHELQPRRLERLLVFLRIGADMQGLRVGARQEARRAAQKRGPGVSRPVEGAQDDERQLREKQAVLIGHEAADVAAPLLCRLGDAEPPLHVAFAIMPGRVVGHFRISK